MRLRVIALAAVLALLLAYLLRDLDEPGLIDTPVAMLPDAAVARSSADPRAPGNIPGASPEEPWPGASPSVEQTLDSEPSQYYRHPTRPYGVAGHAFFMSIARVSHSANSQAAISSIQRATDVDDATAHRLLEYIRHAVETHDAYFKTLKGETCARRDELSTVPRLAEEFERTELAIERRRVQLVRGAESIIGEDGQRKLDLYLDRSRSSSSYAETDYEHELMATGRTPADLLHDSCSPRTD